MASNFESSDLRGSAKAYTKDINKTDRVPNLVSSSSSRYHPANETGDVNTSSIVSKPVSTLSSQTEPKQHTSAVNKPFVVSDPNKVIKWNKSKMFRVRMASDSRECCITSICETATGLLLVDKNNHNVKLLDQDFKLVAHLVLPASGLPVSICRIDSGQVAVAAGFEVHFIRVTNGQLVKDRTMKVVFYCVGIAHHEGKMYTASCGDLGQYTMDGRRVCTLYDWTNDVWDGFNLNLKFGQVNDCAISPDGNQIYVSDYVYKQLLTLSRDGKVIATLADPLLKCGYHCLHVTDLGQVLVCNYDLNTIVQVSKDGRQILAEVVTGKDGVAKPTSVCYSKRTGTLVVGMSCNDNIMVLSE